MKNIREQRQRYSLTMKDIAIAAGVTVTEVYLVEIGGYISDTIKKKVRSALLDFISGQHTQPEKVVAR